MRLATTSLVTLAALVVAGCTASGTPAPSSVTVTPVFYPPTATAPAASPGATTSATRTVASSTRPERRRLAVQLSGQRIGALPLGAASPSEVRDLLGDTFGKGTTTSSKACAGRATAMTWGSLTVTFTGVPQVAQNWQVDTQEGTKDLRLPRGTEWRPDRAALSERDDVSVATSGSVTTMTLPSGFSYRFPDGEQRARFVSAGTLDCG